jgi:hypothetical protein
LRGFFVIDCYLSCAVKYIIPLFLHLTKLYARTAAVSQKCLGGGRENKWVTAINRYAGGHNYIFLLFDGDITCRNVEPDDTCCRAKIKKIKNKCNRDLRNLKWDAIVTRPCLEGLLLNILGCSKPASPENVSNNLASCVKLILKIKKAP